MATEARELEKAGRTDWTVADRREALEVYGIVGAAKTSEILGIPAGQIVIWAQAAGLTKTRTEKLAPARRAFAEHVEYRKAVFAAMLLGDADLLRRQLFVPTTVHHFTKDGGFVTGELAEPTFRDKQAIMTSIAIIVDKVQLLTGAATARIESLEGVTREEALSALDELKTRRSRLELALPADSTESDSATEPEPEPEPTPPEAD